MERLTGRQRAVLEAIQRVFEQEGVPPTTRELARKMGLDPKSVSQHLDRLERLGFIFRKPRESRNIRLTEKARLSRGVPLVGQIAAGRPVLAEENVEGFQEMEDFFGPRDSYFLLRLCGDSMKGAGMRDGDVVAVRSGATVPEGGIAVVTVDGEATVKRLYREDGVLRLEPENPDYEALIVDTVRQEVRVVGPVIGLIRRM